VPSRRCSQEVEKWINLGASCLVQELINDGMLPGRMMYIDEEGGAADSPYRRPSPLFGTKGITERLIREGAASGNRVRGNSLSTHQSSLPRKKSAIYRVITGKSWKWVEF